MISTHHMEEVHIKRTRGSVSSRSRSFSAFDTRNTHLAILVTQWLQHARPFFSGHPSPSKENRATRAKVYILRRIYRREIHCIFQKPKKTWLGLLPQTIIYLQFLRTELFDWCTRAHVSAPVHTS